MRQLATIKKIEEIKPILDADRICAYRVDGWWVVDQKEKYKVGDLAIYCEIDSWIPHEMAPFLSKGREVREYNGVKGERLRTIRLKGQLSQGLILPIDTFVGAMPAVYDRQNIGRLIEVSEGMDVTEYLGIQKWEAPIPAQLAGQIKGMFPSAIPKTDQERIQNLRKELMEWVGKDLIFEVTEKLDGASCTMYLDSEDEFHVCSRNLDLKEDENNSFWRMARKYDIEDKMRSLLLRGYAIQGELIGPGIQGNPYNLTDHAFYVFDVYSTYEKDHINTRRRTEMCAKMKLDHVPIIGYWHVSSYPTIDSLLKVAEEKSRLNPKAEREGLVFKDISTPSISFKAISNKFLLGGGN